MFTIKFEKECGCFKKSGFENNTTELLRSTAMMRANQMCNILNNKFGGEGKFIVEEEKKVFTIKEGKKQGPVHCCGDGCCL